MIIIRVFMKALPGLSLFKMPGSRLSFLGFQVLKISIVVLCDEEVAFGIHTVLDLRDRQKDDNDDRHACVAQEPHHDSEHRPYRIPVEHSEVSAVVGHSDPACDESSAEYFDEAREERNHDAGFESALFVGNKAHGRVVKEYRHESADDDRRRMHHDQQNDRDDLPAKTCEETESNSVGIAETEADCAVDTRDRRRKQLVRDTLEGSCQLCNEGTYAELQDRQVDREVQGCVEAVEYEVLSFCGSARLNKVRLSDDRHDDSEEYGHEDSGTDHVLVENREESGQFHLADLLDLFLALSAVGAEDLVSEEISKADTEHLLMRDREAQ